VLRPAIFHQKKDVDTFLSESNRDVIDKRLLIASTDQIGPKAKNVCADQPKPVTRFLLFDFEKSGFEYPSNFSELQTANPKPPPTPRPHQLEAITKAEHYFKEHDRGQLIMACGTGKTLATLWIKERLEAERTLVFVPSLSLLSQTLREWTNAMKTRFDVLCVCSDETVGRRKEEDALISSSKDIPFPVTSDVQEIARFLKQTGPQVVFSTYQSSPLITESQKDPSVPTFDLVVADEAHRCAVLDSTLIRPRKRGFAFSSVLKDTLIRARKRLFTTATPRTYSTSLKKKVEERGIDIASMDDEQVFGRKFYTFSFRQAIERDQLTDYQVVIVGVDKPTILQWIRERELVQTKDGVTDYESLASQIGLIKAIKDYDLKRIISFHSRIKSAKDFSSEIKESIPLIREEDRPDGDLRSDFVSGEMSAHERRIKMDRLRNLETTSRQLLSNAKCLSEGVDVPALDGVAFIDPKRSQVDIVQAVGRAIRKSEEKTVGTIVLPVFIEEGENAEETIEKSTFEPIWKVLLALKSHDEVLADELDQLRTNLGRKKRTNGGGGTPGKIVIDLPAKIFPDLADSLSTLLVEKTTESWHFWFGLLEEYVAREGHARVHIKFKTDDGYLLGA